jgi:hypothetical protein
MKPFDAKLKLICRPMVNVPSARMIVGLCPSKLKKNVIFTSGGVPKNYPNIQTAVVMLLFRAKGRDWQRWNQRSTGYKSFAQSYAPALETKIYARKTKNEDFQIFQILREFLGGGGLGGPHPDETDI